jgi:lysophospholipase L1-like esterase
MHTPLHSLIFGLILFLGLAILCLIFPSHGIQISENITVSFPRLSSFFEETSSGREKAIKAIEGFNKIDTSFAIIKPGNDVKEKRDSALSLVTKLQYKNASVMRNFFDALSGLDTSGRTIRVMHYGDSQIEGDRITDFIRLKLQSQFGGGGPGFISLLPLTSSIINKVSNGRGWDRYSVFTARDKRVSHNNYGIMASFSRYCGYRKITDTSVVFTSSVGIITTPNGGKEAMDYSRIRLYYGGSQKKTWCEFYDGPALNTADSLEAGGFFKVKEYIPTAGSYTHTFKFRGKDSPDFYGLSLESENGVIVDNIPCRGSSGTFFHQVNVSQLKNFYDHLNVKLLILQFGGNSVPAIKDATMATNFADYIRYQISIIKKVAPGATILFIGPSDMSVKEGTDYVTYPFLEEMRDALKKTVIGNGCVFFDLYDCMGGRNSMPVWVSQKLAASDYIHFSPQGARKMAAMLYSAIIEDYNNYLKGKK